MDRATLERQRTPSAGLLLISLLVGGVCPAADPLAPDALRDLLQKDPAAGFEAAAQSFEAAKAAGDLDGMLKILRLAAEPARECWYTPPLDDMVRGAAEKAQALGKWEALAETYAIGAEVHAAIWQDWRGPNQHGARMGRGVDLAREAYSRAGVAPDRLQPLLKDVEQLRDQFVAIPANWEIDAYFRENAPAYAPELSALFAAQYDGNDAEAVSLAAKLVKRLRAEYPADHTNCALMVIARCIGLPGGSALVKSVADSWRCAGSPTQAGAVLSAVATACADGWGGRDDVLREGYYWALGMYARWLLIGPAAGPPEPPVGYERFVVKAQAFGRTTEATTLLGHWLRLMQQYRDGRPAAQPWSWGWPSPRTVPPDASPETRTAVLGVWSYIGARIPADCTATVEALMSEFAALVARAPADQRSQWAREAGAQLAAMGAQLRVPETRTRALNTAGDLLAQAGVTDRAGEVRAMAAALTRGDAQSTLSCALGAAAAGATDGRWEEVVGTLEPALAAAGLRVSRDLLEATLLLAHAKGGLGRAEEAEGLLQGVPRLLGTLNLPPGDQVEYLMAFASETRDADRKLQVLDQARAAATDAGLDLLQDRITEQIAQVSLDSGNTAAAEQALIEVVNRQERSREALAFDPLLRRQWFADNLSAYRTLLRLAAVRNEPELALRCAERMRSRALLDELSWRKVDLAARLPAEVRGRLDGLRVARQETYALLRKVLGGQAGDSLLRGSYIPIRGAYLPIRGIGGEVGAEAGNVADLRKRLDSLATEEAALGAAVREAVPAYATASQTTLPEPADLVRRVTTDPGLAVLEYTLCDQGLVVVGLRANQPQRVALIAGTGEDLRQRIGDFRAAIQERRPETETLAGELYTSLIAPVESLFEGAQRLWVVADGALQLIPFAALRDAGGRYLAQRLAVATVPSLSLALSPHSAVSGSPAQPALIIAAPDTGAWADPLEPTAPQAEQPRGAYLPIRGVYIPIRGAYLPIRGEGTATDVLTLMAGTPLPGAKAEGEAIARQVAGAVLVTGKEATKERVLRDAGGCALLHIATHGYADPEAPEFSGVLLASAADKPFDILTAQEVYLLRLRARLVTLSACQTGLGKTVEGEGLLGLTRAFIYAGAQDVVCSLWPVSDESTQKLMEAFYANLKTAGSVEEALTQAQRALLQDEKTKHPFYWAAFVPVRGPQ